MFLNTRDDRVSNPNSQNGGGTCSPTKKPICGKCGKKHYGDYPIGINKLLWLGKSGHKVRDFPNVKG